MLNTKKNYIFSATKYEHPIHRSFYKKKGDLVTVFSNMQKKITQDFQIYFMMLLNFIWLKKSWLEKKKFFLINQNLLKFQEVDPKILIISKIEKVENLWKFNKN